MDTLTQDFRYALRSLRKSPGFTTTAVLALALGIGATTVIVSVFDHVVLRPLAYPEAERLVVVRERIEELSQLYPSVGGNASHFLEWQRGCASCEEIGAARATELTLTGAGETEQVNAVRISANLLSILGAVPAIGTTFTIEGDRDVGIRSAVLSDAFWRRRFGADLSLIGRTIVLNNAQWQVVGVLPPSFQFPRWQQIGGAIGEHVDLFIPLALTNREATTPGEFDYAVVARVARGATIARVRMELDAIEQRLTHEGVDRMTLRVIVAPLREQVVGASSRPLGLLLAAIGAVLAIVCVNLSSLVLARNLRRYREAALRIALGAGRTRVIRQTLVEAAVIGVLGGTFGVLVASWGLSTLLALAPPGLPRLDEVTLDGRVLLMSLALSLLTGFSIGMIPALRASRSDPGEALKGGGRAVTNDRRARRVRVGLIVTQVGLTVVLLVSAGLLVSSFVRVLRVDRGFGGDRVLALDVTLPSAAYPESARRAAFYDEVLGRLTGIPGVQDAALTTKLPLEGETQVDFLGLENDPRPVTQRPTANILYVSPRYFESLGIAVRGGRVFSEADRGRSVVVLSGDAARATWGDAPAVGKRVVPGSNDPAAEIIGVVADIRNSSLESRGSLIAYVPYWQRPPLSATLLVRTDADPARVTGMVRDVIRTMAPGVPVRTIRTMPEVLAMSLAPRRFQLFLLGVFAFSALLTATIGIYGIISQSLAGRSGEIGIRLAIGARPADVRLLVLREGLVPVVAGIGVGTAASLIVGRLISGLLFQVHEGDPFTIVSVAAVVVLTSALACWFPARRAARLDPVVALRNE
jgi:predicted permease